MNVDPRFSPDQLLHRATVKRREAHALMEMAEILEAQARGFGSLHSTPATQQEQLFTQREDLSRELSEAEPLSTSYAPT